MKSDQNGSDHLPSIKEEPSLGRFYPWYVVAVLMVMMIFSYLDRQIIVMLIDPIRRDLGIGDVQVSLLTGFAFALLFSVAGIPLGWAADRFNRRWIIFVSVIFWGLSTAACGLASSFWQLFLGRVGVGVGEATLSPSAFSMLSDIFPPRRVTFAISVLGIGSSLGMGASFLIAGLISSLVSQEGVFDWPLIGALHSWQVAFIAVGLPGPLLALLLLTIKEPKRTGSIKESSKASDTTMRFQGFLRSHWQFFSCHIAGFGAFGMSVYAIFTWAPIYLMRVFGWSGAEVGSLFGAIVAVSIMLSLLAGGAIVSYFYNRGMTDAHIRIYAIAALACIPLAVISVAIRNPWIFLACISLIQIIISNYATASFAAIQIITPNEFRARMTAILMFATSICGLGIGPLFVAMLTEYVFKDDKMVGWSLAITLAIIYPIASLLFWNAARYMRAIHAARMRSNLYDHPTDGSSLISAKNSRA